ncbi:phosphoribosyltransferase [Maribellus sp. CM-23]|uniref:phosphoribosyltransferase n=1 Tax=Maribellus sp. CM-23 TaxID=2781026 RepID=UPI001F19670D|nr:phosphoribosyltransferase [Maribellus sp. CM-23]MCE4566040.1 phosphoribosyltransferase [Maribellus sp. CM-23]
MLENIHDVMSSLDNTLDILRNVWLIFLTALSPDTPTLLSEFLMLTIGIALSLILSLPLITKTKFNWPFFIAFLIILVLSYSLYLASFFGDLNETVKIKYRFYLGYTILGFVLTDYSIKYDTNDRVIRNLHVWEFIYSLLGIPFGYYLAVYILALSDVILITATMLVTYKLFFYSVHFIIALKWNISRQKKSLFPTRSEFGRIYMEKAFRVIRESLLIFTLSDRRIKRKYNDLLKTYRFGLSKVINEIDPYCKFNDLDLLCKKEIIRHEFKIRTITVNNNFDSLKNNKLQGLRKFIKEKYGYNSITELNIDQKEYLTTTAATQIHETHLRINKNKKNRALTEEIEQIRFDYPHGFNNFFKAQFEGKTINVLGIREKELIIENKRNIIFKNRDYFQTKINKIRQKYPEGYQYYVNHDLDLDKHLGTHNSIPALDSKEEKIKDYQYDIETRMLYYRDISQYKLFYNSFSTIARKLMPNWSVKEYTHLGVIPYPKYKRLKQIEVKQTYNSYQLYNKEYSLNNIDISLVESVQNGTIHYKKINRKESFVEKNWFSDVSTVIDSLSKEFDTDIGIVFNDNPETDSSVFHDVIDSEFYSLHNLFYLEKGEIINYRNKRKEHTEYNVLITLTCSEMEYVELTDSLKKKYKNIKIVSITFFYQLSLPEVRAKVAKERQRIEKEKARIQEIKDRKRREEIRLAELAEKEKREREERERREEAERQRIIAERKNQLINIKHKVSNYETLNSRKGVPVKFFYFHNYYPTSESDVTEFDWDVRKLIWNFKDGDSTIATSQIATMVSNKLNQTFSINERSMLTLVCAPASTRQKNIKRFQRFSQIVCTNTGLNNGFEMLTIHTDREGTHLSGNTINPIDYFSFNRTYFRDKKIIIFDDIVTRGRTMFQMTKKLEELGASVILAISIGKTTHKN